MSLKRPSLSAAVSLGCGEFPVDGPVTFKPRRASPQKTVRISPPSSPCVRNSVRAERITTLDPTVFRPSVSKQKCPSIGTAETISSSTSFQEDEILDSSIAPKKSPLVALSKKLAIRRPVSFERRVSSFMRAADLGLSEHEHSFHNDEDEIHANFHHPSVNPPPGMDHDANETWVALDNGAGLHSPVAPFAIKALANGGFETSMDQSMWNPDKKTNRLLSGGSGAEWKTRAWQRDGVVSVPPIGSSGEKDILVWTGTFKHSFYGSELPAIRSLGIVNMGAKSLLDLLVDSSRVQEYNKMSLGRKDVLVMQDNMDEDGPFGRSIAKVIRSESKPPLLRKILRFVSLMHANELEDGSGYMIVTRAVTQASDSGPVDSNILSSEILLGVTLLRKVEGDANRCVMINVNHLRSPMVPMMIAKKLGLSAACNFIEDIRRLC